MTDLIDAFTKSGGDEGKAAEGVVEERHPVWRFRWMDEESR
jgi:hypothetical protein